MIKKVIKISENIGSNKVIRNLTELRSLISGLKSEGKTIGFVPTMGALHDGHLSLVDTAFDCADVVVASIFVNPAQFGINEDLDSYPRDEKKDIELLVEKNVDIIYIPDTESMYNSNHVTKINVDGLSSGLCGDSRPNFFGGIALAVNKLLMRVQPDFAIFGEKDYQQYLVIKQMVDDLDIPTKIISSPIIREESGLAMSSRNRYLSEEELETAANLNKVLHMMAERMMRGPNHVDEIITYGKNKLSALGFMIDYLEVRDSNLHHVHQFTGDARIFAAVTLAKTRLIDNIIL